MQLPVACVKIASGNGVRPRSTRAETVVDPICNRSYGERGAGQIGISTRELPSTDHASQGAVALKGQIIDTAHAEIVCPVEIRGPAIRVRIGGVVHRVAALPPIR